MRAPQKTRASSTGGRSRTPAQDRDSQSNTGRGSRAVARQTGSREVTDWEKELERQAEVAKGMEKGAQLGRSFSFKGGQMMFDGAPVKDNRVVVIVAGAVIEKAFYDGRYDPDNPEPPVCYAFDTDPDQLAPNPPDVADLQCDTCAECPHNVFGSADTGRGKACKDVRRLALIPAGSFVKGGDIELVEDAKLLQKAEFGFAKLPPTSLNAYAAFVRQVAETMKRPPHGVYAIMEVVPDQKNQFMVTWEVVDLVPGKLLGAVMPRHDEAMKALVQPYTYPSAEEQAQRRKPAARGRAQQRQPAGRGGGGGRAAPAASGRAAPRGGQASTRSRKY